MQSPQLSPCTDDVRRECVFQTKLDAESTANWTASPEQTEHLVHGKLDGQSKANWTPLS